jgi:hypothetical protein
MQSSALLYAGDDDNYLAHATAIAFFTFPDYSKEANYTFPPFHAYGAGIMASPFVFAFSLIDRVQSNPVVKERTRERLVKSWSSFGFILATQFYLIVGILLLYRILTRFYESKYATFAITVSVITSGILLYAYRRPVLSHVYEFTTITILLYFLVKSVQRENSSSKWLLIPFIAGIMYLVRYNNAPLALAFIFSFILVGSSCYPSQIKNYLNHKHFQKKLILSILIFCSIILSFKLVDQLIYDNKTQVVKISKDYYYDVWYSMVTSRLQLEDFLFYIEKIFHILIGLDWGLLYTAPFLLIGLWGIKYSSKPTYYYIPMIALLLNFYLSIIRGTQSSWYGYRLLVFSSLPFSVIGLSLLLDKYREKKRLFLAISLISTIPIFSILAFEGNPTNLTLHVGQTKWGDGWINETYQLEVWNTLFLRPKEFLTAIFKGGPLYIVYLMALIFNKINSLPSVVLEKYPVFESTVFIKTLIIWFFPLFFGSVLQRFELGEKNQPFSC